MYDVVLFGGTDEGHRIADFMAANDIEHIVCVATEYGGEILGNKNVRVGRMNVDEMRAFFEECGAKLVVDATHPYADKVTENIKAACTCGYICVARGDCDAEGLMFENTAQAAKYLENTEGNILITTGSKEIELFADMAKRAYARVLPAEESIALCKRAGFLAGHIICMQGPFSKDLNAALMREYNIKYLVTKRSGKNGGFTEKIEAAKECGVQCVIIERPHEQSGVTVDEAKKFILEYVR